MGGASEEYVYSSSSSRTRSETLIIPRSRAEYDNSSVGEEEHFELRHIWETLLDWQVWAHILIYMSIIAPRESLPSALCAL